MGNFAREIEEEYRSRFWSGILEPVVEAWFQDEIAPQAAYREIKTLAKKVVKERFGQPPAKPAVVHDNSLGKFLLIAGLVAAFLGLGILGFALYEEGQPVWFGVISLVASIALLAYSKARWMTLEKSRELAELAHQNFLSEHKAARVKVVNEVVLLWIMVLHHDLAFMVKVPARLRDQFAQRSQEQESLTFSQWSDEIHEWQSEPEFPAFPNSIPEGISHKSYEEYCCEALRSWGYLEAKTTRYSRDGGIDIEGPAVVAQCKHYAGSVGVKDIREIFGIAAHMKKTAAVFTSGSYTAEAIRFANEAGVALIFLDEVSGSSKALNVYAKELVSAKTERRS